jgi:thiol-disulfide isomerase/thioredoxin
MRVMARIVAGLLLTVGTGWFLLMPAGARPPADEGKVTLKSVRYQDLVKAVRDQRGKVIVIDVWADFCVPCKKEFHNLVELHQKYGDKGLVCMSVTVDPAPEDEQGPPAGALKFLTKQKATFANYWLDEKAKVWQERWHIQGPPTVFVFDRQGRRAARFDSENPDKPLKYEDVKKLVEKLLKATP